MTGPTEKFYEDALALSEADREALALRILATVPRLPSEGVAAAWRAEIARRSSRSARARSRRSPGRKSRIVYLHEQHLVAG